MGFMHRKNDRNQIDVPWHFPISRCSSILIFLVLFPFINSQPKYQHNKLLTLAFSKYRGWKKSFLIYYIFRNYLLEIQFWISWRCFSLFRMCSSSESRGLFSVSYKTRITFRKQSCGCLDLTHITTIAQEASWSKTPKHITLAHLTLCSTTPKKNKYQILSRK